MPQTTRDMKKKLRVGILFGGKSGEHEISLRSANSILKAIDRKKYDVVEIGITKQGRWLQSDSAKALLAGESTPPQSIAAPSCGPSSIYRRTLARCAGLIIGPTLMFSSSGSPTLMRRARSVNFSTKSA